MAPVRPALLSLFCVVFSNACFAVKEERLADALAAGQQRGAGRCECHASPAVLPNQRGRDLTEPQLAEHGVDRCIAVAGAGEEAAAVRRTDVQAGKADANVAT